MKDRLCHSLSISLEQIVSSLLFLRINNVAGKQAEEK
jgi:hypothetical protein